MKKNSANFNKKRILLVLFVFVFFLFISFFSIAAFNAIISFTRDTYRISEQVSDRLKSALIVCDDPYIKITEEAAKGMEDERFETQEERDAFKLKLNKIAQDKGFLSFSVFIENDEISAGNTLYFGDSKIETALLAKANNNSITRFYKSNSIGELCMAVYSPIPSYDMSAHEETDIYCVCAVFPMREVFKSDAAMNILDALSAEAFFVESEYGGFYKYNKGEDVGAESLPFTKYIENRSGDKKIAEKFERDLATDNFGSAKFQKDNIDYVLSYTKIGGEGSACFATIFNESILLNKSSGIFIEFAVSFVILFILLMAALIIILLDRRRMYNEQLNASEYNYQLKCSTYAKFKKDIERIIMYNRSARFVVVSMSIYNFKYLQDHFGEDVAQEVKYYTSNVIKSVLQKYETHCYIDEEDRFVMLWRYEIKNDIAARLTLISELINHYELLKKNNIVCLFNIGAYFVLPAEEVNADAFVNHAHIAQLAHRKAPSMPYVVYEEKIYQSYNIESTIESKMESALKNCDFHLFYQPKYNIEKNGIDSAEILVRWYDFENKGYVPPRWFIPIFEMNGFINKLDRYVFIHACETYADCKSKSLPVSPISINVSRVTAIQKDFVDFYSSNKEKYKIPDNFIILEFTESFSFTNMDVLKQIVEKLKKCGFRCSIDDFGSGYSSCGILKELPVDELKLDMSLLKPGTNTQKDDALIQMMINLGKSFDMKVVQEGIETMEQYEKIKGMGCDIVQGYLYSKPLLTDDYIKFISGPTDLESILNVDDAGDKINYIDFHAE